MPVIPFAEHRPDDAALGNRGALLIKNAIPGSSSYKPLPALSAVTSALTNYARGAISARDKDDNFHQYAGDAGELYLLSTATWTEASTPYGFSTDTEERWDFVRWKNKVLATNFSDEIMHIVMGATEFYELGAPFRCRHLAVVRDHVVAANTWDSADGNMPDRVRWSAFDDETDWTVDPATQSDYRDLRAGKIQRVLGGEFGIIPTETDIWRMDWEGSPNVFSINKVVEGAGLISPGAIARLGGIDFFISYRGLVALSAGTGVAFPGAGKFDDALLADIDEDYLYRISAAADPNSGRVMFAYPGAGNSSGMPNKIFVYDAKIGKGATIEQDCELLWQAGGIGFTLDALDSISSSLDSLPASLDSSQWKGGALRLAGFDTSHQSGSFEGANMTATLETREVEIYPGRYTRLNAFRALVDGGSVTAQIGYRNTQNESVTWTPVLTQRSSGRFTYRTNARYHRFRVFASGNWTDAIGVEYDQEDVKRGGQRG